MKSTLSKFFNPKNLYFECYKSYKIFSVSIILLFLNSLGCKEECNCKTSYKNIPEEFKEWFWFKEGSWWIYRLAEDSTIFDTLTLTSKHDMSSNKFCESTFAPAVSCSEVLTIFLNHTSSKFFPKNLKDTTLPGFDILKAYSPHGGGEFLQLNRYTAEGVVLGMPLHINEYYDPYTLRDTFPTWLLHNKLYQQVVHVSNQEVAGIEMTTDVWWGKKVGLLKIRKTAGKRPKSTWELIDYNIKY